MYTKYNIKKCFYEMTVSSPALTVSGITYHSERRHSMLDLKPSQAPSIKPPHMGWKRLSKGLSLGFDENQMLWAQLSCLSRTTEQPLLKFHQEPSPSFPLAPALLRVPNQIKSSQPKHAEVPPPNITVYVSVLFMDFQIRAPLWLLPCLRQDEAGFMTT